MGGWRRTGKREAHGGCCAHRAILYAGHHLSRLTTQAEAPRSQAPAPERVVCKVEVAGADARCHCHRQLLPCLPAERHRRRRLHANGGWHAFS